MGERCIVSMLFSSASAKRRRDWRAEMDTKKKGKSKDDKDDKPVVENESWKKLKEELEERERLEARNKRRMDREADLLSFTEGTHDKTGLPFIWMDVELGPPKEQPLNKSGSGRM